MFVRNEQKHTSRASSLYRDSGSRLLLILPECNWKIAFIYMMNDYTHRHQIMQ